MPRRTEGSVREMGPFRSTTLQRLVKSAADTSMLRRNSASKLSFLLLPSANSCEGLRVSMTMMTLKSANLNLCGPVGGHGAHEGLLLGHVAARGGAAADGRADAE